MRLSPLCALIMLAALVASSAATTSMKFVCISPQIDPATSDELGFESRLSVTLTLDELNGELSPASGQSQFSHAGIFYLEQEIFGDVPMDFALDLPEYIDLNGNGLHDFFDTDQPVSAQTSGLYYNFSFDDYLPFTASWSREAGENAGFLQVNFPELGTFTHVFRLVAYEGTFTHERVGDQVSGSIQLANIHDPADTISGALSLKVINNLTLSWSPGVWHGANDFSWEYEPFDNFDVIDTAFASYSAVRDGFPLTATEDYRLWLAVIEANDANDNRVPDLVEEDEAPQTRPELSIARTAEGLELTITGTSGATYTLETAGDANGTWTAGQSVTMPSAIHKVTIQSDGAAMFYRLKI